MYFKLQFNSGQFQTILHYPNIMLKYFREHASTPISTCVLQSFDEEKKIVYIFLDKQKIFVYIVASDSKQSTFILCDMRIQISINTKSIFVE